MGKWKTEQARTQAIMKKSYNEVRCSPIGTERIAKSAIHMSDLCQSLILMQFEDNDDNRNNNVSIDKSNLYISLYALLCN